MCFSICCYTISSATPNTNIGVSKDVLSQRQDFTLIKTQNNEVLVKEMLNKISDWILTLDLSSNNITGVKDTLRTSIFINGNLARVLISNYKLSGKEVYLQEALKWCDTFVSLQHDITTSINTIGGYWDTGYSQGKFDHFLLRIITS